MTTSPPRLLVLSDFNVDLFRGYLAQSPDDPAVEIVPAPFGQVMGQLVDPTAECWRGEQPYCLVWTRPEGVIAGFARLLDGEEVTLETILAGVDAFAAAITAAVPRARKVLVASWVAPLHVRTFGLLDMKPGAGLAGTVARMNLRLGELLELHGAVLLNTQRWLDGPAREVSNPKRWYLGKIAFGNSVFRAAAADLKAALRGLRGEARKLIVVDLDQTLWGGIVGDDGWENLQLGGHDPVGEAYVDFQRALKTLSRRGVMLAIVSKNDEALAREAVEKHPEMVLRMGDFAGWRINWDDKARNLVELVTELNLGLSSVVFIDDSDAERARVREALPEVLVPDWPGDPMLFPAALLTLDCFDVPALSVEDAARTRFYAEDRARQTAKNAIGSLDEWLQSLATQVTWTDLGPANLARAVQLLNKTNQLNLRTRRMTEHELGGWAAAGRRRIVLLSVSDRFGNAGLTGLLGLDLAGESAEVEDFVLSCRVMGRRVEETMAHLACALASEAGMRRVRARHVATPRNSPCLEFWRRSGFDATASGDEFVWDLAREYPLPAGVTLVRG